MRGGREKVDEDDKNTLLVRMTEGTERGLVLRQVLAAPEVGMERDKKSADERET